MVELAPEGRQGLYRCDIAGDTFNTAVYLAQAGHTVSYLTRLGDDIHSANIESRLEAEGIATDLVVRCPGRQPGLYVIDNDESGERQFSYWREHAPAREMFEQLPHLTGVDAFYFSGITLAITRDGNDNLLTLLQQIREFGGQIIFDPNYRPALWESP